LTGQSETATGETMEQTSQNEKSDFLPAAPASSGERKRIELLDALRGIASLTVAWFHFTNGEKFLSKYPWLQSSGKYGWLGLSVFFVISGFVIPLSLHASGYHLKNLGRFMIKRIVRLDPPYLVSVFMMIFLFYVSRFTPGFQGTPFHFSAGQFFSHFAYVNAFAGYSWYNPVYWTLAIEFQWYLFMALGFGLLVFRGGNLRWGLMAMFIFLPFIFPSHTMLCHYMPLFGIGVVAFQFYAGMIRRVEFAILLVGFSFLSGVIQEWPVGLVGGLTVLIILFVKLRQRWLLKLGAISYSLYLVHVPVGGRVINLSTRLPDVLWVKLVSLALALALSLLAAWLLWKFVEKPAMTYASRIKTVKPASGV
jgi:peptidoglycan/LPS O-acetylase OafA/YrhL